MKRYLPILLLCSPVALKAQRKVVRTNMLWGGYYFNGKINDRLSLQGDLQIRSRDWTNELSQTIVRSGLAYKLHDKVSLTAGMAWFTNIQYIGRDKVFKNELRPWQEVALQLDLCKGRLSQRFRAEQRFQQKVQNGKAVNIYDLVLRLRYKADWQRPVSKNISLIAANEIMINPTYIGGLKFFDQDRISAAIHWKTSASVAMQFQCMKIYQWKSKDETLEDQNVFRIVVYHQVNIKGRK